MVAVGPCRCRRQRPAGWMGSRRRPGGSGHRSRRGGGRLTALLGVGSSLAAMDAPAAVGDAAQLPDVEADQPAKAMEMVASTGPERSWERERPMRASRRYSSSRAHAGAGSPRP